MTVSPTTVTHPRKIPSLSIKRVVLQDNWYFRLAHNEDVITAWVAIDDADAENGALSRRRDCHLMAPPVP